MINQVRTLLLNQNGSLSPGSSFPGEEYVPPGYTSRLLSPALSVVAQAIFGKRPDRAKLNYRLKDLMTILHTTELKDYVTALDSRTTYDLPPVITPQPATFSDTFTRAGDNAPTLGANWLALPNEFGSGVSSVAVVDNVAVGQTALDRIIVNDFIAQDSSTSVTIDGTGGGGSCLDTGVIARMTSDGSAAYVGFIACDGITALATLAVVFDNGGTSTITTGGATALTGVLRLEVVGSTLSLFLNDVLQLTATDTRLTQAGRNGIYNAVVPGGKFTNFSVTELPVLTNSFFDQFSNTPTVIQTAGSTSQLYTVAPANGQSISDQLFNQWSLVITDGSHATVTQLSNPYNVPAVTVVPYTITNGLSSLVQLPGTECAVRWQDQIGAAWIITWLLRPLDTLVDVGNNLTGALSPDVSAVLFGVQPDEPYLTFKNLWELSPHLPYRIAGATLALAYRTNELVT